MCGSAFRGCPKAEREKVSVLSVMESASTSLTDWSFSSGLKAAVNERVAVYICVREKVRMSILSRYNTYSSIT